ncbi:hypothetical protein [Paenibacillus roseipurpureus]|uniref:Uncharacterized protein n=1 Tax=Paenibacillus roseopurpureus TaxID=2918901 RepID=A0AA96RMA6_9BACL|nr:hypothetical protein [Paenibacillus sp. MBLB1832]WNR46249.1 hypothetical protein MJB10_09190 [Paenibacillus sp. MBLB1832]
MAKREDLLNLRKNGDSQLSVYMEEAMSTNEGNSLRIGDSAYYKVLNQKVNTWRDHAGMARYTSHPKIAQIALELTGATGIRLFHDHAQAAPSTTVLPFITHMRI